MNHKNTSTLSDFELKQDHADTMCDILSKESK